MAARPGRGPARPNRAEARLEGSLEFMGRERERERGADHPVEAPDPDHERLLADYDAAMELAFAEIEHAFLVADGEWAERMRLALARLLTLASRNPEQARLCTIRVFEAGALGLERRDVWMARFTGLCESGYAQSRRGDGPPRLISPIAAGALFELIRTHASEDRLERLSEALPTAVLVVLAPVVGREAALALAA
ncbi:MAG TPA: hypothetical protein VEW67_03355 [Thermoleophilaceae bacterium]|nr:hypothetical protein [Thermoleophilaceae bacterium]